MTEIPQGDPPQDEVDDLYRRAVARDPSRPDEATRRAILDHAARLAAERTAQARPIDINDARRARTRVWRPAILGTLAAALLAGLVVVPRLWTPPAPRQREQLDETALTRAPPGAARAPALADKPAPILGYAPAPALPAAKSAPSAEVAQSLVAAKSPRAARSPQAAEFSQSSQSSGAARSASAFASQRLSGVTQTRQAVDATAALRRAAQAGDLPALNRALDQPLDVNARDGDGKTALMLAILNGQGGAVDALLAHGADPNAADATGGTPLAAALARGDSSIVSALRRAGAHAAQ